jgi:hypothetical protein
MSYGFLFMMVTVFCTVGVYYLWSFKLGLNENTGLLIGVLVAVLVSYLLSRFKKR